jgi:hypothetical protein
MPEHAAAGATAVEPTYAFGPFVLDAVSRRLWRDGEAVAITARVFDILFVLIRHQGRPVEKDVLIEQVWGDLAVEDGNLARNISTLRKLVGEAPDDHRFIVTPSGPPPRSNPPARCSMPKPPPRRATAACTARWPSRSRVWGVTRKPCVMRSAPRA